MLQRIYGCAFDTKEELAEYLKKLEEAHMRDHNRLGREMHLFTTVDVIGQGLPLLMPKGARIVQALQRWVEDEEEKRGYLLTKTPLMAKKDLYIISDHWQHYKDGMEEVVEEAKKNLGGYGKRTILFIDEIHRFNKGQQDYLLPFVEDGTVILIGATTENPYFEVNSALLSRSTIFELHPLSKEDIGILLDRAMTDKDRGLGACYCL